MRLQQRVSLTYWCTDDKGIIQSENKNYHC